MASPATTYIATPNSFPARSNVAPSPPVSASPASFDLERGRLAMLERSGLIGPELSIIVPRDHLEIEIQEEEFPPGDARAMSPRRNSADVERLVQEARQALKEQAETLQSSLIALVERVDDLKRGQEKLERENKSLRDYIGNLTRTMSKSKLSSTPGSCKGQI